MTRLRRLLAAFATAAVIFMTLPACTPPTDCAVSQAGAVENTTNVSSGAGCVE